MASVAGTVTFLTGVALVGPWCAPADSPTLQVDGQHGWTGRVIKFLKRGYEIGGMVRDVAMDPGGGKRNSWDECDQNTLHNFLRHY